MWEVRLLDGLAGIGFGTPPKPEARLLFEAFGLWGAAWLHKPVLPLWPEWALPHSSSSWLRSLCASLMASRSMADSLTSVWASSGLCGRVEVFTAVC